ncbi:MAG TPA: conserved phage C-terminal domain-containing protein [Methanosarcina sp.]|nr:conserved phage C-terminal domain-containing protein [Methanosarcina sp.]
MANPWFRMYSEFMHDPKVQMLSEQDQRRLVMILCMRCNSDVTLQDNHVTFTLRISNEEWMRSKNVFIQSGFIDEQNNVLNWDKRQFISDSSAARVAKHRALHKQVNVTQRNVTVTSPEQNRTEQKHKKPSSSMPDVLEVLEYLNEKASRNYKPVDANAKFIIARFNEGATVDDLKRVIDAKVKEWGNDAKWSKYLRPATLFNAEKFAQYSGETSKSLPVGSFDVNEWLKAK